ncbi:MAG: metal-dependent transcriptional regulator [Dehalococcoidales bacterium]|nr:metal-dependent transcriptional regulator [Dehalococcoidales bacterium]
MSRQTIEEYLETIKTLEEMEGSPVRTSSLARVLTVSAASVSEMLQRLSEKGMVRYTPYSGVSLTEKGLQQVLKLTRRHRLWEVFLNRYLGISWEEVYNEACNLEHNTSELVAEKLAQFLGNPTVCPHGSPIPDENLKLPEAPGTPLTDMETGKKVKITRITNEINQELLYHINGLGLAPGAEIEVIDKALFDGTITIKTGDSTRAISAEVASFIKVEPVI